ncbi:MAG: ABC transporter transmembrane domain-containing protein, partial [Ginsengibacter sp.]
VLAAACIFILSYLQSVFQTYISEKVARNLRSELTEKISGQDYNYIRSQTTSKLLTNITSDTNAVKMFISQAVVSIISSVVLIIGTAILLLNINWRLGLIVLIIVPLIITTFMIVFKKVRVLFKKSQEVVDWLNKVINESILGAALIRVLNAQAFEYDKFIDASGEARNLGLKIVRLFSLLIPIIVFTASMAQLAVVGVGGHYIILGNMTLGEFAAFNSYIAILIFPLIVIGFTSGIIARASASYQRICHILDTPDLVESGTLTNKISGNIELENIFLKSGEDQILKDISFSVTAGSRTAIIGPTAAGKTQLLNIIIGLLKPTSGQLYFDGIKSGEYRRDTLLNQIAIVFQDSII